MFIIRVWIASEGIKYFEAYDLSEAKEMADGFAATCKKKGVDYDVLIYEATNY